MFPMTVLLISVLLIALLLAVVVYDVLWFRIPNALVVAILLLFLIEAALTLDLMASFRHLGAGVIAFVVGFLLYCFRLLGGGDAKLLAVTGTWTGLEHLVGHFLMFALIGGAVAVVLIVIRRALDTAFVPQAETRPVKRPRVLMVGESIPYGVPIAISLVLIHLGYDPVSPVVNNLPIWL